jgi:rod shape-determining protein MreD
VIPYAAYSCICILLIILKTAVLSNFVLFNNFYDILLPLVLYLGLFRPVSQGIPLIFFYGYCMDSVTGGPFGLYIMVYSLLFILMRWTIQFLHAKSILLKPLVVLAGVIVENLILLLVLMTFNRDQLLPGDFLHRFSIQITWAAVTGPVFLVIIDQAQTSCTNWYGEWVFQRKENRV